MQTIRLVFDGQFPASRFPLRMVKGTTFLVGFEVVDATGAPVSLVGCRAMLEVKAAPHADTSLILKTLDLDDHGGDPANGLFVLALDPLDTAGIDWGWHVCGIGITLSAGMYQLAGGDLMIMDSRGVPA